MHSLAWNFREENGKIHTPAELSQGKICLEGGYVGPESNPCPERESNRSDSIYWQMKLIL